MAYILTGREFLGQKAAQHYMHTYHCTLWKEGFRIGSVRLASALLRRAADAPRYRSNSPL